MSQTEIPRADGPGPIPDLIPVRMLNEFAYCPRLAYLEWVQGEWGESADTLDGTYQHRRVNVPGGAMPGPAAGAEPAAEMETIHSRSVHLSAVKVGLVAVIDLVEGAGDGEGPAARAGGRRGGVKVTPVDYKRGRVP